MPVEGEITIEPDHPSLPGHFPGDPIVPGVVLLDAVLCRIVPPGRRVASLPGVRFVGPVRPGDAVTVTQCDGNGDRITFSAARDGAVVLRGTAVLAPIEDGLR